jgi:hypothetical protein
MTMHPDDLRADLEAHDADDLLPLGDTLRRTRPVPAAAFRGDLRRWLLRDQRAVSRPRRLWLAVAGSASVGSALLAVAAIGVAGSGPFAA